MKVAQMMATIPEALPPEYAEELMKLQAEAPSMGAAFVKRRMQAELEPRWREALRQIRSPPRRRGARSARSIARSELDGSRPACQLQYPDMASAVEADLAELDLLFSIHRRMGPAIDTREIALEIGARVREELDYRREAKLAALYRIMLADRPSVRVPRVIDELSTGRLLTMEWLEGERLVAFEKASQIARNAIAMALFEAWWRPFSRYGGHQACAIPIDSNCSVIGQGDDVAGVNLFDYGCIRIFPSSFVGGVVDLYQGLKTGEEARVIHAYETWGFVKLKKETIDALNIWARFIYGPLIDDRKRAIADGVKPAHYGRREAFTGTIGATKRKDR